MKLRTIHEFEMLQRVRHFLHEHPELSAKPRIADLTAELQTAITATRTAARGQIQGAGEATGGTATRREKRQQLRSYLKDLARVARSLDQNSFPGLAAHFLLPSTRGYNALIVSARTMIKVASDLESTLISHGLPVTFLTDLTSLVDEFTTATNTKFDGLQTQVAGTSGLKFHASRGVKTAQKLDAILRAHFRNDPITLKVWHHARHIQVDPKPSSEVPVLLSPSIDKPLTPSKIEQPPTHSVSPAPECLTASSRHDHFTPSARSELSLKPLHTDCGTYKITICEQEFSSCDGARPAIELRSAETEETTATPSHFKLPVHQKCDELMEDRVR